MKDTDARHLVDAIENIAIAIAHDDESWARDARHQLLLALTSAGRAGDWLADRSKQYLAAADSGVGAEAAALRVVAEELRRCEREIT